VASHAQVAYEPHGRSEFGHPTEAQEDADGQRQVGVTPPTHRRTRAAHTDAGTAYKDAGCTKAAASVGIALGAWDAPRPSMSRINIRHRITGVALPLWLAKASLPRLR